MLRASWEKTAMRVSNVDWLCVCPHNTLDRQPNKMVIVGRSKFFMNPENVEGGILILSVSELYYYLKVWNCRNLLYCVWQNNGGLLTTNVITQVCPCSYNISHQLLSFALSILSASIVARQVVQDWGAF
jgi:hypothetical protein